MIATDFAEGAMVPIRHCVDEDGFAFLSYLGSFFASPDCDACLRGACIQRVHRYVHNGGGLIIHDCAGELS